MIYSFIIVNYNTKLITGETIQSLLENHSLKNFIYEIIVVDNNSSDGSQEYLKKKFPLINLIQSSENIGFGRANNLGSNYSSGDYLVFINSDTLSKNTNYELLLEQFKTNENIGFLSCKILNENNSIQSLGFKFPSIINDIKLRILFWNFNFMKKIRFKNYKNRGLFSVDWVSGCFMICEKESFFQIGQFDKSIFMYSEDLDICYRMVQNNKLNYVLDTTSLYHLHGKSSNNKKLTAKKLMNNKKNYFYVIKKNNITKGIWILRTLSYINVIILLSGKKISPFFRKRRRFELS